MLIYLSLLLLLGYVVFMLLCLWGWHRQTTTTIAPDFIPKTRISVLVAARNEAANIATCIQHIAAQAYPQELLDIIIVDDHSTDETAAIVSSFQLPHLRLLSLATLLEGQPSPISFKKKAIEMGVAASTAELIVCTDADCWMGPNWLKEIAALYEISDAKMIIAPVQMAYNTSILALFQTLDFMTMQGITLAVHRLRLGLMCNGANIAFSKSAFETIHGYQGQEHLISGDDYLLLLKMKSAFPDGIRYLKSSAAIVQTLAQATWSDFIQQRIRWASKSGKYKDNRMHFILLWVFVFNAVLLSLSLMAIVDARYLLVCCALLIAKIGAELLFLWPVARFYKARLLLVFFPFLQPLHIGYVFVAGFLSRFSTFNWKSRTLRQS